MRLVFNPVTGNLDAVDGDILEGGTGGVAGQVAEFVTDDKHIQAAKIIGPTSNILTITNTAPLVLGFAGLTTMTFSLDGESGLYSQNFNGSSTFNFSPGKIINFTGSGTLDLGGYTATVPNTGTLALGDPADTKEPTGWVDPSNIIVTYDSTTQKITLTAVSGTLDYYWRGVKHSLSSPWVSAAHTNTVGHQYYLSSSDGTNFTWATDTVWTFDVIMVAFVNYQTAHKHAHVETHGLMQWQVHEELHEAIGTYKESGGTLDPASYTLASTTATNRRPNVVATHIHDEDIDLVLAALTSKTYNKFSLSSTSTINFSGLTAEIISVTGAIPNYNLYTGGAWTQQAMTANTYTCVWLAAMPTTADTNSQTFRYIWIQGQSAGTLASQQALSPSSLNFGTLTTEATEFVVLAKIIINYQSAGGGDWVINSVENITGSKFSQVGSVAGSFLTTVAVNGSLTGDGTLSSPLSASSGATTATAGTSTTLTVSSATMQEFTGSTTQTVVLPVVTTLRLGHQFYIINHSSGAVTVNSSGGNLVATVAAGNTLLVRCILLTGTTAASWDADYLVQPTEYGGTGTGNLVRASSPTIVTPTIASFTNANHTHAASGATGGTIAYTDLTSKPTLREVLTAARTYYVRTDGSDSNTGLANTAGGAFLTIQKAIDVVATLDSSIYDVTIQIADGTYVSGFNICKNMEGTGSVLILGNSGTPDNVVIDGGFQKYSPGTIYVIRDMKLTKSSGTATIGLSCTNGAQMNIRGLNFSTGYTIGMFIADGAILTADGNYKISGGCTYFLDIETSGIYKQESITVTLTGTPAFTIFILALISGVARSNAVTYSGGATGIRYYCVSNAAIETFGGGANYFPGNSAGISDGYGYYG